METAKNNSQEPSSVLNEAEVDVAVTGAKPLRHQAPPNVKTTPTTASTSNPPTRAQSVHEHTHSRIMRYQFSTTIHLRKDIVFQEVHVQPIMSNVKNLHERVGTRWKRPGKGRSEQHENTHNKNAPDSGNCFSESAPRDSHSLLKSAGLASPVMGNADKPRRKNASTKVLTQSGTPIAQPALWFLLVHSALHTSAFT